MSVKRLWRTANGRQRTEETERRGDWRGEQQQSRRMQQCIALKTVGMTCTGKDELTRPVGAYVLVYPESIAFLWYGNNIRFADKLIS